MVAAPAIRWADVWHEQGWLTPPVPPPPDPDPPGPLPTREAIIAATGHKTPFADLVTEPLGKVELDTPGAVYSGRKLLGSIISVQADNVTISDCYVETYTNKILVQVESGVTGTVVEDVTIICEASATGAACAGAVGSLSSGEATTVRRCDLSGFADGIKADGGGSLYERNWIHMSKPATSSKHLDGIQGSADSHWTARQNVIDMPISLGGNAAVLTQAWSNGQFWTYDTKLIENYFGGGNWTIFVIGGKDDKVDTHPLPPGATTAEELIVNCTITGNIFTSDPTPRYGYFACDNTLSHAISGNELDDGTPVVPGMTA